MLENVEKIEDDTNSLENSWQYRLTYIITILSKRRIQAKTMAQTIPAGSKLVH